MCHVVMCIYTVRDVSVSFSVNFQVRFSTIPLLLIVPKSTRFISFIIIAVLSNLRTGFKLLNY